MVNISIGDKLTIITHTHVLMCTVTQVRARELGGCCCEQAAQPDQPGTVFVPEATAMFVPDQPREPDHRYDFPEATTLIEIEVDVEDGVTRR